MDRDAIIARLRASEAELRARGATHAALFGSQARGEHRPDSDIDVDPDAVDDVYTYVGLQRYIACLFEGPVDVRPAPTADALYAF